MTFTNDDTDKKKRQLQHSLRVYILPLLVTAAICILTYFLTDYFNLEQIDKTTGYMASVVAGIIVWFKNKTKWLPLPDGSHFHIDDEATTETTFTSHPNEPFEYEAEFRNSLSDQLILLICGIITIYAGILIFKSTRVIFPLAITSLGLSVSISGFRAVVDRKPKLKLSTKGLWTRKLGFQPWSAIQKTEIVKEKGSRFSEMYLEIYLKNSEIADMEYPDERFSFSGIEKSSQIEKLIEQLKSWKL